jgi:dolichol-phosphate mannosyltransferase
MENGSLPAATELKGPLPLEKGLLIVANYNQVKEIGNFLERADRYFPKSQTVVVDDCSTDGSKEVAKRAGFLTLEHEVNQGIGAAIRTGIEFACSKGYHWVLISSSNGKIRPEDFERVYSPLVLGQADYVTGSRFLTPGNAPGLPLFRRLTIPVFSFLSSLMLGRGFSDITCGFRAYNIDFLKKENGINLNQVWLNRYEMEYYIHYWACQRPGLRIQEVPVTIDYSHLEKDRKSKIKPIIGWWSMLRPFVYLSLGLRK